MSLCRQLQLHPRHVISWTSERAATDSLATNSLVWKSKTETSYEGIALPPPFQGVTLSTHHKNRTNANGASGCLPRTAWEAPAGFGVAEDLSGLSCGKDQVTSDDIPRCPSKFLPGREMGPSVGGEEAPLIYVPYMDYLWQRLVETVPGLQMLPLPPELRLRENKKGARAARCCNWLLAGERLRRIRFTYFEAGKAGQAFNCLFYPDPRFDLPLLGIDLISLGANKILCVIDFLPLEQDPVYLETHTHQLVPIRNCFIKHCGRMSSRHFDENQFFSKQLIFYRSDQGVQDPILKVPEGELFAVYARYVEEYLKSLYAAVPEEGEQRLKFVKGRQDAYDHYNADRDPALKLFTTYFGAEVHVGNIPS